eukprot:3864988-Alexandrium_andersonii.AAC.1
MPRCPSTSTPGTCRSVSHIYDGGGAAGDEGVERVGEGLHALDLLVLLRQPGQRASAPLTPPDGARVLEELLSLLRRHTLGG